MPIWEVGLGVVVFLYLGYQIGFDRGHHCEFTKGWIDGYFTRKRVEEAIIAKERAAQVEQLLNDCGLKGEVGGPN